MSSRAASYRSRTTCLKWSSTSKRFGSKAYILFVYINCRDPIALEYLWRRYAEAILTRRSMRFSREWQRPAWPSPAARDSGSDGFNDTRELDEDAVDDAALVLGHVEIDQLTAERPDTRECAGLTLPHETAVGSDVHREDRC